MTRTAVYRHYDANGKLLYAGRSACPTRRNREHMSRSEWAERVRRTEIEWFDTAQEAAAYERQNIIELQPAYNKRGVRPTRKFNPSPAPEVSGLMCEVLAFCERTGTTKTALGVSALGDPGFVAGLESGREPRWSTMVKVRLWMAQAERASA